MRSDRAVQCETIDNNPRRKQRREKLPEWNSFSSLFRRYCLLHPIAYIVQFHGVRSMAEVVVSYKRQTTALIGHTNWHAQFRDQEIGRLPPECRFYQRILGSLPPEDWC